MNSPQVSCGCNTLSADYIVTCQMYHVSNFCLSNLLNLQKIICKLLIISMSLKNNTLEYFTFIISLWKTKHLITTQNSYVTIYNG